MQCREYRAARGPTGESEAWTRTVRFRQTGADRDCAGKDRRFPCGELARAGKSPSGFSIMTFWTQQGFKHLSQGLGKRGCSVLHACRRPDIPAIPGTALLDRACRREIQCRAQARKATVRTKKPAISTIETIGPTAKEAWDSTEETGSMVTMPTAGHISITIPGANRVTSRHPAARTSIGNPHGPTRFVNVSGLRRFLANPGKRCRMPW